MEDEQESFQEGAGSLEFEGGLTNWGRKSGVYSNKPLKRENLAGNAEQTLPRLFS